MINAAIVGLGWWGKTLVESVSGMSDDIRFVAGATRTRSPEVLEFASEHQIDLLDSYEELLADPGIDAVVLATPHSIHVDEIVAASAAGKHIYAEKPLALTKAEAERAIEAVEKGGVALGIGFNRRFHPSMIDLNQRVKSGALGTMVHFEVTMSVPNLLYMPQSHWRADRSETPCGGLTPMGVHAIDAVIDMLGEIDEVYCQSVRRAVEIDSDDTTSVLFRLKNGVTGYLGVMMATAGSFRFQVYGSEGWVRLEGMAHVAGASSEERRSRLFGACQYQPVKGEPETWQAETCDIVRASLESFAAAADGGPAYPVSARDIIHGVAATEAVVKSSASGQVEKVG